MNLVVFFSRGMSLEGWRAAGILERELALYRAMLPSLERLAFVTYGGADDVELGKRCFPEAEILANLSSHSANRYSLSALWTHRRALRRATAFKTNQINGAWTAVLAKRVFHTPLLVRCGFLWTQSALSAADGLIRRRCVTALERWIFRSADRVVIAAPAHRAVIEGEYGVAPERVRVISNYVDTATFTPMPDVAADPGRVVFVGRLSDEKNPMMLLDAIEGIAGARLVMIGDGRLRGALETAATARHLAIEFLGAQPHDQLPRQLNRASVFVLPSQYEGNPKALLEAMACGVPVVGTRVRGIQDVLRHEQNGLLCEPTTDGVRSAIARLLADTDLGARLAATALADVRRASSLEAAVASEQAVLRELSGMVQRS